MWDDGRYISSRYTREDYIDLALSVGSHSSVWGKAIEMFEDRINGRYLNVIKRLLEIKQSEFNPYYGSEFSIMAIECLLIETLQQFREGVNATQKLNSQAFIDFLCGSSHFKNSFNSRTAKIFYEDIRCGILHQAQTKKNSQLASTGDEMVMSVKGGIRVNVELFTNALINEFENYVLTLKSGENAVRINFIKKMDFVVRTQLDDNGQRNSGGRNSRR